MKKLFFRGALFFLSLSSLGLTSCSDDDKNVDVPQLFIKEKDILVPKSGIEKTLNLETNVKDLKILVSDSWIHASFSQNSLIIRVDENNQAGDRSGYVEVVAKDIKKTIAITQEGEAVKVMANPEELIVASPLGDYSVQIVANTNNFRYLSSVSWISGIRIDYENSEVFFHVNANDGAEARTGEISFISNGNVVGKLVIKQKSESDNYILPSFEFGLNTAELKLYEEGRNSELARETDTGTGTLLNFRLKNNIFDEVSYLVNLNRYVKSSIYAKGGTLSNENQESFENYLRENGFIEKIVKGFENTLSLNEIDKKVFINEEKQVRIEFMNDKGHNHYTATYFPKQLTPQATLKTFPFFKKGATLEEVKAYELQNGGKLIEEKSRFKYEQNGYIKNQLYFEVEEDTNILNRNYWVYESDPSKDKQGLVQITNYYTDSNIAFYQGKDGKYYLTNEFIELAKQNNYDFIRYLATSDTYLFQNNVSKETLRLKWYKDKNYGWVVKIWIF
ncbi:BACON domain-containing protein [Ornithobacterium rhinotracheale]|uniref:BACON domain-containing protein n=1 Tax=Ornithobacterium rhinotracheale TaxID=28251 RepID=UPI001FF2DEB4|nr:BACON domain-containing carbohydrate-binding protein [Ornithobacterium rhinotracheale]MCK0200699.1 hypothetical protein [Ornithobacterium rhinotracheale]UVD87559.1 hypothetical protein NV236_01480 [Ornithobacterium rhinotracheale]